MVSLFSCSCLVLMNIHILRHGTCRFATKNVAPKKYFLENVGNVARINKIMSEFIFFTVMSIVFGFLPFIRASVVSIVYAARLSSYICNLLFMRTYDKTLVSIIAVIMLLILTFSITIGINLCGVITKIIKDKVSKNKSKSKV